MPNEKNIHALFRLSLVAKGFFALVEFAGGIALFFVSQQYLADLVTSITQDQLAGDPDDFISNFLVHSVQHLSGDAQHFAGFYLATHGLVKGLLVLGLWREKLWTYPIAIVVFVFFIVYQVLRFSVTHSPWLLALTALDVIVIALAWHEYRYLERMRKAH